MKLQAIEAPLGKTHHHHLLWKAPKVATLIALTLLFTVILIYYPYMRYSNKKLSEPSSSSSFEPLGDPIRPSSVLDPLSQAHLQKKNEDCPVKRDAQKHDIPRKCESLKANFSQEEDSRRGDGDVVAQKIPKDGDKCDLFSGEWVPDPNAPYYTNDTCRAIQQHQNCMKFGRPDTGFMKWRWKPDGCELPVFDPLQFLELVRGKSLAFVGDSVARNHMQSLICLLSRVDYPVDVSNTSNLDFRRWEYRNYNFNMFIFWSPYLVKTKRTDPNDISQPFNLYLDEFDDSWTTQIEPFEYVIISAGQWFFRPSMFYVKRQLAGCLYCPQSDILHRTPQFSYREAFRTAFRAINSLRNYKGVTLLRTFSPSHFEGGLWNESGNCARTKPFRRNEIVLDDNNLELYSTQLEELGIAEEIGRKRGLRFRLMDMTRAMLMRPDGHPTKYGHWPVQNVTSANDCVHWCLPGPVDTWNDFLLAMLKREEECDKR